MTGLRRLKAIWARSRGPRQKGPRRKLICPHLWIMTAIHNHDRSCDFGADGPWDGAYAEFCIHCHKWTAEVSGTSHYRHPQMVAEVDQKTYSLIEPVIWHEIEHFRGLGGP